MADNALQSNDMSLNKRLDAKWDTATYRRPLREALWFRNAKFVRGEHWLTVDARSFRVVERPLPVPNFPRAVTNRVGQIARDLENFIIQSQLPLLNTPGTDDPDDVATAEALDRFDDVLYEEAGIPNIQRKGAAWLIATGNVFLIPYYDYDPKYGIAPTAMLKCETCGLELPDGDEAVGQATAEAVQLMGELSPEAGVVMPQAACPQCMSQGQVYDMVPFEKDMPIGKLCTDVCGPFEIYKDNNIPVGDPLPWFFRRRRYSIDKAKELWPEFKDKIKEGLPEPKTSGAQDYLEALAHQGVFKGTTESTRGIYAYEYREMPCAEYPEGLRVVRLGADLIVEQGPLPDEFSVGQRKGQKYLSLIHIVDITDVGSGWGRSRLDDIIPLNVQRNIVGGLMQLSFQRTGAAKLFVPYGSGVRNVTGEAGQVHEYKPINFGGSAIAKPEYLEAALGNLGPIINWIALIDDAMENLAGTKWIAGGEVPSGIRAASALALLDEKSVRALRNLKEQWIEGLRQWKLLAIEILRKHMTDERILTILGRNRQWESERFKNADLQGAVDVRVDREALFPKSEATRRATVTELVQIGAANPQDPEVAHEVRLEFGMAKLSGSRNDATLQAQREWDKFLADETYVPKVMPGLQDSLTHLIQHRKDSMSQEFEQLPPERQMIWAQHAQLHMADLVAAQMSIGATPQSQGAPSPEQGAMSESMTASEGEPAAVRKGREVAQANDAQPPEEPPPAQESAF